MGNLKLIGINGLQVAELERQMAAVVESLAAEIVDQLESALEEFRGIEEALGVE